MTIRLKMAKSMDHDNNEFHKQQMQANPCQLVPQADGESVYYTGNSKRFDSGKTEKQQVIRIKRKSRTTKLGHEQGLHECAAYHNDISLNEASVTTPLCATLNTYNSSTNLNKIWPTASEITGCSTWRCCSSTTCPLHTAANMDLYPPTSISTTSSEFMTCCSSARLTSKSCKTSLPLAIAVSAKSFNTSSNTTGANTQFTSSAALLYNLWHQLFASLVWHITASTVISVLVTLCWIIGHTQGVVALSLQAFKATAAGGPVSVDNFYTESASITTTTATTTVSISLQAADSLALTTNLTAAQTQTKSQRYNRGNKVKSSIKTKSGNNSFSSKIATNSIMSPDNDTIDKHGIRATEITFPNDISPGQPIAVSSSSTFTSGYDYDTSGTISATQSTANHNDFAIVAHNGANTLNDSLERIGNDTSGGGSEVSTVDGAVAFDDISAEDATEYVFDRTDVRIIFITLYTMVFCCCFFGNLLVILVVTLSRRLRSITNFFLANLALADFCVGLFCVMQNLSIYLIDSWVFGEFLCRMYQFVHSLSYTASIFILVVICMERYFAIVHPITCKQILTAARLRMVILTVWITSAVYSTPKFVFSKTIKNIHTESGREEEICVLDRKMFNSKLLDMINFVLLYVIPLLVMTVLYSKIAIALWRSSRGLTQHLAQQRDNSMGLHNSMYHHHHHQQQHPNNHHHHLNNHHHFQQRTTAAQAQQALSTPISGNSCSVGSGGGSSTLSRKQSSKYEKRGASITESQHDNFQVSLDADRPVVSACRKGSFYQHNHLAHHHNQQAVQAATGNHHHRPHLHHNPGGSGSQRFSHYSHSSNNVLRARRGVVRMLIIFVLTFALCNLPYHARKMWQYWSRSYRGDSNFNALLTPLTFLVTYFNSGINPLLYAFLSRNFRKGMKELLMCSWRKSKTKSSTNSSMHHKRMTLQNHSLPTDTTHIGNEQL